MQVIVKPGGSLSDRECLRLAVRSGTLRARQFLTCYSVAAVRVAKLVPRIFRIMVDDACRQSAFPA